MQNVGKNNGAGVCACNTGYKWVEKLKGTKLKRKCSLKSRSELLLELQSLQLDAVQHGITTSSNHFDVDEATITFHSFQWNVGTPPSSDVAFVSAFDTLTQPTGYCSTRNWNPSSFSNTQACRSPQRQWLGYKIEIVFYEPSSSADWVLRFRADWGWGGVVMFDDTVIFSTRVGFHGVKTTNVHKPGEGLHHIVLYGAEQGADGNNAWIQFSRDGGLLFLPLSRDALPRRQTYQRAGQRWRCYPEDIFQPLTEQ
eukprot:TRINITY_DN31287_c0_g1_i1.p1 TRINITY_DN31287_c0_g1~~TRINITY_DN31287_c0_g1_i1.p1  ORF type:complete len:254 (-),score=33.36 TRINITY_DN31287_c0_g1_i1:89-850(-)